MKTERVNSAPALRPRRSYSEFSLTNRPVRKADAAVREVLMVWISLLRCRVSPDKLVQVAPKVKSPENQQSGFRSQR